MLHKTWAAVIAERLGRTVNALSMIERCATRQVQELKNVIQDGGVQYQGMSRIPVRVVIHVDAIAWTSTFLVVKKGATVVLGIPVLELREGI